MSQFLINPYSLAKDWLLDTYTGAAGAYAVRRLSGSYTGACLRVRRNNDDTEQDIGFDAGGNLDEAQLTAFVGANSGFVTTWYDQSGNGRNATQTTSLNQPRIVNSGTVDKVNNKVSLTFDGSNDHLIADSLASTVTGEDKPLSVFSVASKNATGSTGQILAFAQGATITPMIHPLRYESAGTFGYFIRDNASFITNVTSTATYSANTQTLLSLTSSGLNAKQYKNGSGNGINTTFNRGTLSLDRAAIGALRRPTTLDFFAGKIQEIVFYASDQDTNRSAIDTAINGHYSIY
jgi:hypothetical protein